MIHNFNQSSRGCREEFAITGNDAITSLRKISTYRNYLQFCAIVLGDSDLGHDRNPLTQAHITLDDFPTARFESDFRSTALEQPGIHFFFECLYLPRDGWLAGKQRGGGFCHTTLLCSLVERTQLLQMILLIVGIVHTPVSQYRMGIGLSNVYFYNNPNILIINCMIPVCQ